MTGKWMLYAGIGTAFALAYFGWKLTARGAYESAEYRVLDSDGIFEVREYPDLMVATTEAQVNMQGKDGSFMRLFRYISGGNEQKEKIAMTTPVFMAAETDNTRGRMGFVMPKSISENRVPDPSDEDVEIRKRMGGQFAVIRFSGRIDAEATSNAEDRLREWMNGKGLIGVDEAESAGYDPPWTPGPLRRNEILIRLK
jgi:hypothetical protein